MSTLTLSATSFDGKEVMSLREAFYQAVFQNPTIDQFHTVVSGIQAKQQLLFLGLLGLTGKKLTDCTVPSTALSLPITEKFWEPVYVGDRIEQCYADLLNTFFVWGLRNGVQKADLTNTDFALFLEERFSVAAYETALRLAWLGDTAADVVANGGYLTAGTDPGYFNILNGFWEQAKAVATADATKLISIPNNSGATFAAQGFTAADTENKVVTTIFESMIYSADLRLRGAKDKVIVATQSMVDQYARERKAVSNVELAYERTESGIDTFKVDGVDVVPFQFLDRHIKEYMNNGTKWNQPHRALFTTKGNLQIGTEETTNFTELDPFYDKKSKTYSVDYAYNIDAKLAEDYLVMAAY